MRFTLSAFIVIFLSACQITPTYQTNSVYNPEEILWSKLDGDSSVSGSAFLRTNGGAIVTCAGYKIRLYPESTYANERLSYLYGNLDNGFNLVYGSSTRGLSGVKKIDSGDPRYHADGRVSNCDVDGKFKFTNLPNGVYYLSVPVLWNTNVNAQGGYLLKKVDLTSGGDLEVVLTM